MGRGKAKIAIMLMPFQLHLKRSHDTLFSSISFIGLWHVSGLIGGIWLVPDPDTGDPSGHVDFAKNINLTGQK